MDPTFDMKRIEKEIYAIQKAATLSSPEDKRSSCQDVTAIPPAPPPPLPPLMDEDDPFNKFWGMIEPMMEKLPVIDDNTLNQNNPIHYDTTLNDSVTEHIKREMADIADGFFSNPDPQKQLESKNDDDGQHKKSPKEENEALKEQMSIIKNQIRDLEKKSVDSTVLKSSIVQFKNDIQKQALRILQENQETAAMSMTRSASATSPTHNIRNTRPPPHGNSHLVTATTAAGGGASTAEIVNRIKELEDMNRTLRLQNKKQEHLMAKYKERWEKLKEGARKRHPSQPLQPQQSQPQSQQPS